MFGRLPMERCIKAIQAKGSNAEIEIFNGPPYSY